MTPMVEGSGSKRAAKGPYTYIVYVSGADTYAEDWKGTLVYGGPRDTGGVDGADPVAVLQACVDALDDDYGGIIFVTGYWSTTSNLSITTNNVSIIMDNGMGTDNAMPNFECTIDASSGDIRGVNFVGCHFREIKLYANGNNIQSVHFDRCRIGANNTSHGLIFEGDGTSSGYIMDVWFNNCLLYTTGTDGASYGVINFTNLGAGTSQIYFTKCGLNLSTNNDQTMIYVNNDARIGLKIEFNSCDLWTSSTTGLKFLYIEGSGAETYATGIKVQWTGGIFENHGTMTIITIDSDASAGKKIFGFEMKGALISCNGTTTFMTNSCTNWASEQVPYLKFRDNYIHTPGNFSLGTIGSGIDAEVDIADNVNYNPIGKVTNPFDTTQDIIEIAGTAASPEASTDYIITCGNIIISSTDSGDTNCAIVIKSPDGTQINPSALSSIDCKRIPRGYSINWGAFTGAAPTVVVSYD